MLSKQSRKTVAALVAGAFILAGVAGPLAVQAAPTVNDRPAYHQRHQVKPEQVAKRLAKEFGIDQSVIVKYQNQGKANKDLVRAAFLAKASDKSFESVITLKTDNNTWQDVANTLGVDKTKLKTVRQEMAAKHLSQRLNIPQNDIQALFNQGYHQRDIAMAGLLASHSNKSLSDVLGMKKINNTWQDVSKELGVDLKALKQEMKQSHKTQENA